MKFTLPPIYWYGLSKEAQAARDRTRLQRMKRASKTRRYTDQEMHFVLHGQAYRHLGTYDQGTTLSTHLFVQLQTFSISFAPYFAPTWLKSNTLRSPFNFI